MYGTRLKDQIDPRVYNMVDGCELKVLLLTNLMTYPYASADLITRKNWRIVWPTDYWTALDGYKLRDGRGVLEKSGVPMAVGCLTKITCVAKEAHDARVRIMSRLTSLEEQYEDFVAFYDGNLQRYGIVRVFV